MAAILSRPQCVNNLCPMWTSYEPHSSHWGSPHNIRVHFHNPTFLALRRYESCTLSQWALIQTYVPHKFQSHLPSQNTLEWRHNGLDSVSNHQPHDCLLNIEAPRHWPLWGDFTGDGEFPAQMASNAEKFPFDDVIMKYTEWNECTLIENIHNWFNRIRIRLICINYKYI